MVAAGGGGSLETQQREIRDHQVDGRGRKEGCVFRARDKRRRLGGGFHSTVKACMYNLPTYHGLD
jgi:hypothetical protein